MASIAANPSLERAVEPEVNPFASPQTVTEPAVAASNRNRRDFGPPYASGHGRAVFTIFMFVVTMLVSCVLIGSSYLQVGLLERIRRGANVTEFEISSNDTRQSLAAVAELAARICTAIVFLMWFHRIHRNLPSLRARGLEYSPGWAVGGFFVPFLNLVRPYQVMSEVWRGSDPSRSAISLGYVNRVPGSGLVVAWWLLYLGMSIMSRVAVSMTDAIQPGALDLAITASWTVIYAEVVALVAAIAAILLVSRIDARQTARYEYFLTQCEIEPERPQQATVPDWLM